MGRYDRGRYLGQRSPADLRAELVAALNLVGGWATMTKQEHRALRKTLRSIKTDLLQEIGVQAANSWPEILRYAIDDSLGRAPGELGRLPAGAIAFLAELKRVPRADVNGKGRRR